MLDPGAMEQLLEMTGGDPAFLDELVDAFETDAAAAVADLEAAVDADDAGAMVRPAHTLKSNAATFGAGRLTELCGAVEADGRAGSVPDAAARVAAIRDEVAAVTAALRDDRQHA